MNRTLLPSLFCLVCAMPAAAEEWLMIGRGGECFPIREVLEVRMPEAAHVHSPDAFVSYLRGKGHETVRREQKLPFGRLVAINVTDLKQGFGFAERSLCESFAKPGN